MGDEDRQYLVRIIGELTGSKGKAGVVPQETLATLLGVTVSTVARWGRGETEPDEKHLVDRLAFLHKQRTCWYLRVCPFVLALWMPGDRAETEAEREHSHHSQLVKRITFEQQSSRVVRATITLDASFRQLSFCVIGPERSTVVLSRTPSGVGSRWVNFDARTERDPRTGRRREGRCFEPGEELPPLFLQYTV